ncbi:MAG TPA: 50S ribosomal protein L35 [Candidatus Babeliales bacterium]|nr:50S ribosomal protein L35 [Candidatus Babeliales bacterium]
MPKMKTSSSGKKRFKKLASGKIKRSRAFRRHLMTSKSRKNKRQLRKNAYFHASDLKGGQFLLPY